MKGRQALHTALGVGGDPRVSRPGNKVCKNVERKRG